VNQAVNHAVAEARIQAVLTDIEGTTSSLSFVHEVLFPYARERMAGFVRAHASDKAVRATLDAVGIQAGRTLSDDETVEQLIQWIDEDRKYTPLKELQGLIWEDGYRRGDFVSHVYEDAVEGLRKWHAMGLRLYVYSSGSVHAQKLLFGHTLYGNLTPLFSGYFDTNFGAKRETDSYRRIALDIGMPPAFILFLSDIGEELDAAQAAGMGTVWLVREAFLETGARHRQVRDFSSITAPGLTAT
jgi:enolase-phosphatase E1